MEKTTQWGILGLGKIAHKFTQDLLLVPGNQLAAVGSRDAETAAAFARQYGARQAYGNYEALLADPAVEIIYVATPHDSHAQWSIAALEAGKHVLCEKPLAVNRKQVDAMLEAARRNNRFLMEGLWSRFNPSIQQSLKLIEQETIGPVNYFNIDFNFYSDAPVESRVFNPELAGGALLDIGIYPVFLAYLLWGKPEQILASARFHDSGADAQTSIIFRYPQGFANLMCGFLSKSDMVAKIYGTRGSIFIDTRWHEAKGFTLHVGDKSQHFSLPTPGNGFTFEIEECQQCLAEGRLESELWSHRNSLDLIDLLDEIRGQIGLKYPFE